MGVPALFRWLSKKYPKIITAVIEAEEAANNGSGSDHFDASLPNPNGFEVDNLYLDMNGIVHPCTHPEGKPPPDTEEDMMVEIFIYTERVVNMVRPRKLLFMAVDGVAPRAKMNQQRSRRFRAVQEAREKEKEREAGIAMFEAMGRVVSDETKNKKSWDTNAITPGTPFMQLLAASLRYWVTRKLNTDPAWKNLKVIISDASVPGEGEHKIMDFIRRQRVNPGHNPNTEHVIYGLDADLIMLSLATHEPRFKVLREDVFAQEKGCRICGDLGHYADRCPGKNGDSLVLPNKKVEKKPFIFLDVSVLREYLEIELNIPNVPFQFDLERAIDDWIFLIFFVGNDFLPHLPSLEIREGAIDTLLRIWREELPSMGGYLTNQGFVVMERAQYILEGLGKRENDIFRRRREAETRQDESAKRRRIEGRTGVEDSNSHSVSGSTIQTTPHVPVAVADSSNTFPMHHSLPPRPSFDMHTTSNSESSSFSSSASHSERGVKALSGSNADVVNNRRAIRLANMTAAEHLKAELASRTPLGRGAKRSSIASGEGRPNAPYSGTSIPNELPEQPLGDYISPQTHNETQRVEPSASAPTGDQHSLRAPGSDQMSADISHSAGEADAREKDAHGVKRKADLMEEVQTVSDSAEPLEDEEQDVSSTSLTRKVNPDGTVEQVDTIRLWEPGYRDRYYQQKFGADHNDRETKQKITKAYLEGLCWVLHYYYQGTPSWQWFYPYHFAPFASDFEDVGSVETRFTLGVPFKPFEQLMGVLPSASRKHLPQPFQQLMIDPDSPILDFYPETFEIDMNGKKMAWQGVALLSFIDQNRLLAAMTPKSGELTDEELQRNSFGNNAIFTSDSSPLYDSFCALYTKKRLSTPTPVDTELSDGLSGSLLADPACVPGSTYYSPLSRSDCRDVHDDHSISALYFYPKQIQPHRSALLSGARQPRRVLTGWDHQRLGQRRFDGARGEINGGGRDGYHTSSGFFQTDDNPRYGSNDYRYGSHNAFLHGGTFNSGATYGSQWPTSYPTYSPPYSPTSYSHGDKSSYGGHGASNHGQRGGFGHHQAYHHSVRGMRGDYNSNRFPYPNNRDRGRR